MSSESIRPTTLIGIKRLAKSIKVEGNLPHHQALNEAALRAGFQNFRHATSHLPSAADVALQSQKHTLYITGYWRDREKGTDGRETLPVELDAPWAKLTSKIQLSYCSGLRGLHVEGPDHLVYRNLTHSQSATRRDICRAARTFQFMDATHLRPSKSSTRVFPGGRVRNRLPHADHYDSWYDAHTGQHVFTDEPYERAATGPEGIEREAWSKLHDWQLVKVRFWMGMYNPDGGTCLFLAGPKTGPWLTSLASRLDVLPSIVERTWTGESAPQFPYYVSPGSIAAHEQAASSKRPMIKRPAVRRAARNTVGYMQTFVGPQRRPDARMPIQDHKRAAALLKSILVKTSRRKGVSNRVNNVRCELDEWVMREYTSTELPQDQFSELYYGGSAEERSDNAVGATKTVEQLGCVKGLLQQHYPDCPPLRRILKQLDLATKSYQSWAEAGQ